MFRGRCEPRQRPYYKELCNRSSNFTSSSPPSPISSPAVGFEDYWEDASVCLKSPTSHDELHYGGGDGGGTVDSFSAAGETAAIADPGIKKKPTIISGYDFHNKYEDDCHVGVAGGWMKRQRSFPPPVASCVTRSIKEGGRFVLKEMDAAPAGFIRAERENGRLRLHLVQHKEAHDDQDPQLLERETVNDVSDENDESCSSCYGRPSEDNVDDGDEDVDDDDDCEDLTLTLDDCDSTGESAEQGIGSGNNEQGEVSEYSSSVSIRSYGELADGYSYAGSSNIMQVEVDGEFTSSSLSNQFSSSSSPSDLFLSSSSSLAQDVAIDPLLHLNPSFGIEACTSDSNSINAISIENHSIDTSDIGNIAISSNVCGNMARSPQGGTNIGSHNSSISDHIDNANGNMSNLDNPTTPCSYPKHLYLHSLARMSPTLTPALGLAIC